MSALLSEYEFEALPELAGGVSTEWERNAESEAFFGAVSSLARRVMEPGSPQRSAALWIARQALDKGLPALGRWAGTKLGGTVGGSAGAALGAGAGSWLGDLLPQQEYENALAAEFELSPIRKIYPDAMMEHLGHAAAETQSESEAEALAGAMIPLAARLVPRAGPVLIRATPGLVCGVSGVTRALRRNPQTRPLLRVLPAIVRRTAATIAQQAAGGRAVTPQAAVRTLARQTLRVLGSPQQSARAFRRSQVLDRRFHAVTGPVVWTRRPSCPRCGTACPRCGTPLR